MTTADEELFAGMIKQAMNAREVTAPIARVIEADEMLATDEPERVRPAKANTRCPCGSGHHGYNLFDHKGDLLLYCCFSCEKPRRALLKKDGETLTKDG